MTEITVLRDRYVRGWPAHDDGERAYVLELGTALERPYSTDAHLTAYRTPNGRRLTRDALDRGVAVEMTAVLFDLDGPDHQATPEWRRETRERVQALATEHPSPYYYETRGGARLVYIQAEPTVIRTHDDARAWRQQIAVAVAYLERRFGLVADPGCSDWQRLYRLPCATREPGGLPENLPTWGDSQAIGALEIRATHDDVDTARRASKAFREPRVRNIESTSACDGFGVLYWALRLRNDVIDDRSSGVYVVRCPREREHTTGSTGDGSTLLYLPDRPGDEIGHVHCLHGHCADMTPKRWLAEFSATELATARERAGVANRRAA
ncbi:MAG: hypothetical protein HS104_14375 [Polyangiaceae bacterium]|nr:hypothetical protein [Polyangiaceae bacterium]MCL4748903.1 hypothetical protein [Myxococcales bacterium]